MKTMLTFALLAALSVRGAEPPPGYAYEKDLRPHSTVVTNAAQAVGSAITEAIAGKRDKDDMAVYGEVADKTKPYLADDLFPIVCDGETFNKDEIEILYFPAQNSELPYWELVVRNGRVWFQWPDGAFSYGDQMTFNGRAVRPYEWPRLSFPASVKPTADTIATMSAVTNAARSVVNTVWDAALGVAWEARMHNGALYYIAVTNRPPEVEQ